MEASLLLGGAGPHHSNEQSRLTQQFVTFEEFVRSFAG
jgi:hypothetical protein